MGADYPARRTIFLCTFLFGIQFIVLMGIPARTAHICHMGIRLVFGVFHFIDFFNDTTNLVIKKPASFARCGLNLSFIIINRPMRVHGSALVWYVIFVRIERMILMYTKLYIPQYIVYNYFL